MAARVPTCRLQSATGSGKSVCINAIAQLSSSSAPSRGGSAAHILIGPKVVELSVYGGIPHLLVPRQAAADQQKASAALS
ncbi:MAG: FtsK/SpoIIIE domain-containing protein [Christensenellales bacterium]